MVRDRGSEPTPPPPPLPPPLRSAPTAVDRPRGELRAREPTGANEQQEVQPVSGIDAGACGPSSVPYGWGSLLDSAVQAPTGVGGSRRDCTRTPDRRAATAADCAIRGGRRAVSDQSPSFSAMEMVRDCGSEPTPSPPPPVRSASTAVDRPHGEPLAREPANVIERQKVQSASRVDAGACNASGVACGWRPGRGSALIDNAVPAPTGAGGSGRDCARTPDRRAATATDRGLQGGWGSVSDQSPSFDVMAVVRNHGSKPMPPAPSLPPLCGRRSL